LAVSSPAKHLRGVVLPEGVERDVFVAGGRLTFEPQANAQTVFDGGFLIPGLVDTHAHLALSSPAGNAASEIERVTASARAHLDVGVLLVREPGSPGRASLEVGPDDGLPRVITAGRFLAPPGRYYPGLAREVTADALPDAAEREAKASGAWVKVIADFSDDDGDGAIHANYPPEILAEACRRAHGAGARLAVHVMSVAGMDVAVEAAVDSIEHGEGMTEDHIAAMVRGGIALVPTLTILPLLDAAVHHMGLTPAQARITMADLARHPEMVARAAEAGVLVLAGTDAGMVGHGLVIDEVAHLVAAGLPPAEALAAASWSARRYLGLPGIEEGAPADLVGFADDPRVDPAALRQPRLLMLAGRLVERAA
jgi:imidazolonepropionase-like amidohydrolase